jgi:hypothetical protein
MILEYIDRATITGLQRLNDLALGIPLEVASRTEAYLVVVWRVAPQIASTRTWLRWRPS